VFDVYFTSFINDLIYTLLDLIDLYEYNNSEKLNRIDTFNNDAITLANSILQDPQVEVIANTTFATINSIHPFPDHEVASKREIITSTIKGSAMIAKYNSICGYAFNQIPIEKLSIIQIDESVKKNTINDATNTFLKLITDLDIPFAQITDLANNADDAALFSQYFVSIQKPSIVFDTESNTYDNLLLYKYQQEDLNGYIPRIITGMAVCLNLGIIEMAFNLFYTSFTSLLSINKSIFAANQRNAQRNTQRPADHPELPNIVIALDGLPTDPIAIHLRLVDISVRYYDFTEYDPLKTRILNAINTYKTYYPADFTKEIAYISRMVIQSMETVDIQLATVETDLVFIQVSQDVKDNIAGKLYNDVLETAGHAALKTFFYNPESTAQEIEEATNTAMINVISNAYIANLAKTKISITTQFNHDWNTYIHSTSNLVVHTLFSSIFLELSSRIADLSIRNYVLSIVARAIIYAAIACSKPISKEVGDDIIVKILLVNNEQFKTIVLPIARELLQSGNSSLSIFYSITPHETTIQGDQFMSLAKRDDSIVGRVTNALIRIGNEIKSKVGEGRRFKHRYTPQEQFTEINQFLSLPTQFQMFNRRFTTSDTSTIPEIPEMMDVSIDYQSFEKYTRLQHIEFEKIIMKKIIEIITRKHIEQMTIHSTIPINNTGMDYSPYWFLYKFEDRRAVDEMRIQTIPISPQTTTPISSQPFTISPQTNTPISIQPFVFSPQTTTPISSQPFDVSPTKSSSSFPSSQYPSSPRSINFSFSPRGGISKNKLYNKNKSIKRFRNKKRKYTIRPKNKKNYKRTIKRKYSQTIKRKYSQTIKRK